MPVQSSEIINTERLEALFENISMRRRNILGERAIAWAFDEDRAARLRKVTSLSFERKPGYPTKFTESETPFYFAEIVRPIELGKRIIYTAHWATLAEDKNLARSHLEYGHLAFLEKPEHIELKTPLEIYAAADKIPKDYCEFGVSMAHAETVKPPIYLSEGLNELIESAEKNFPIK